jgi:hypothetical protein
VQLTRWQPSQGLQSQGPQQEHAVPNCFSHRLTPLNSFYAIPFLINYQTPSLALALALALALSLSLTRARALSQARGSSSWISGHRASSVACPRFHCDLLQGMSSICVFNMCTRVFNMYTGVSSICVHVSSICVQACLQYVYRRVFNMCTGVSSICVQACLQYVYTCLQYV